MVTGFDIWGHDAGLRKHWKGRFAAFLVDAVIAFVPTTIVLHFLAGLPWTGQLDERNIAMVGLANSVVFYLLSAVPESLTGASIGKKIFGFRVHPTSGESLAGRACMRNIPRFFWFALPPIDFAAGMATRGDPRQKLFDRLAGTKVVHESETERHENALKGLGKKDIPEKNSPVASELCLDCGGKVIRLPDEKLQCEKCGRIQ